MIVLVVGQAAQQGDAMYKATIRALLRRAVNRLNEGDPSLLLRMAAPDCELVFPGDNSWAAMHREVVKGRAAHVTHRGIEECRAFADRFVANGIQFAVEDILVNGPPWHLRVALRAHDFIPGSDGDVYNNRAVAFLELRWGKLVRWEDYEDTERVAAWDRAVAARS
jgi:ketosteroid isomerase-like protein